MDRIGEGTYFTIDRKIFTSDIWHSSPWTLKIWFYLLGHASHKDTRWMGIPILRGQLIRSYPTIAKDCGYYVGYRLKKPAISTVWSICEELTKAARIERRTESHGTLFTICNYNDLQPFGNSEPKDEAHSYRKTPETYKNVKKKDILSGKQIPYSEIVNYLNSKCGKSYKSTSKNTRRHIHARHNEGFTISDFKTVIDAKCKQWGGDPKMVDYLRPETLFGSKFESYLQTTGPVQGKRTYI